MTVEERIADLRRIALIEPLGDDRVRWLAEKVTERVAEPGDVIFEQGQEADEFFFLLDGRVESTGVGDDGEQYSVVDHKPWSFAGGIPLLAGMPYPGTTRAVERVRLLVLSAECFFDLVREEPHVRKTVLQTFRPVFERFGRIQGQREKLAALGSLSAGLAHELNNPAAAASRAAEELAATLRSVQAGVGVLADRGVTPEKLRKLAAKAKHARDVAAEAEEPDALERSDLEDALADALASSGVDDPWDIAPDLVEIGIDVDCAAAVVEAVGADAAPDALAWVAAGARAESLARQLAEATERITTLVRAVKEYTYMDQAPTQDVDVHKSIKTTLTVLGHKFKKGDVRLVKELSPDLPLIHAYGSELNQVWTNLLDNAVDAIGGDGTITIRTCRDGADHVLVEILDDGPGIPEDVQSRIFEPFFTTKDVGSGTGLGLDVVYRIVQQHRGTISVRSRPGETRFSVRLPVQADAGRGNGNGAVSAGSTSSAAAT